MSNQWSIKNIPNYDPVFSIIFSILLVFDYILNYILYLWGSTSRNILGGDLYRFSERGIFSFLLELITAAPTSTIIPFRFGPKKLVIINDVNIARSILTRKETHRGDDYDRLTEFFGQGIFTSKIKNRWIHQRNIITHLFSKKSLNGCEYILWERAFQLIEKLKGKVIDLPRFCSKLGLIFFCEVVLAIEIEDMCGSCVIGEDDGPLWTLSKDIDETLYYINGAVEPFQNIFSERYRKFTHHRDRVHRWIREVIHRVRKTTLNERQRVLSVDPLINEFLQGTLITNDMVELMISVVLGSHETVSRLIFGIIYMILQTPSCSEKIREEPSIKKVGYRFGDTAYINQVVNEGLRLSPPVWLISRVNDQNLKYGSKIIPAGTSILIPILVLLRDKKIYGQDAEIFRPERFYQHHQERRGFIPFAVGPEACPGKHLAEIEAAVVIQLLFQNYRIELLGKHKLDPHSMGTFRMSRNMSVKILDR